MTSKLQAKDKYGSYHLSYQDGILSCVVVGAIGFNLAKKYVEDLKQMVASIDEPYWGYCADFSQFQAYTSEAASLMPDAHKIGMEHGCVADSYKLGSALSVSQLKIIRTNCGIETLLQENSFVTEKDCHAYLRNRIANMLQSEI